MQPCQNGYAVFSGAEQEASEAKENLNPPLHHWKPPNPQWTRVGNFARERGGEAEREGEKDLAYARSTSSTASPFLLCSSLLNVTPPHPVLSPIFSCLICWLACSGGQWERWWCGRKDASLPTSVLGNVLSSVLPEHLLQLMLTTLWQSVPAEEALDPEKICQLFFNSFTEGELWQVQFSLSYCCTNKKRLPVQILPSTWLLMARKSCVMLDQEILLVLDNS